MIGLCDNPAHSLLFGVLCLMMTAIKTGFYVASGPMGSYRILLGYVNYKRTREFDYLTPIICVGASKLVDPEYMLWPIGSMSLVPE